MSLLNAYITIIRLAFIVLSAFHIYKREFKYILSTGIVYILTYLPQVLRRFFHIRMDLLGNLLYITIIVMTIYLGNVLQFYNRYRWWDQLIHFLSGITFVSFGVAISMNQAVLNRFHILFFSLTLSITLHVVWEVLEYVFDCIFHTDNQRWQKVSASKNHLSQSAIQPAGLVDTMNDTIFCIVGTVVSCIVWWFVL